MFSTSHGAQQDCGGGVYFIDVTQSLRRDKWQLFPDLTWLFLRDTVNWETACCPRQKSFVSPLCAKYTLYRYCYDIEIKLFSHNDKVLFRKGEKTIFVSEYNLIDYVPGIQVTACGAQTSWRKTIITFYWIQTWEHQVIY